MKKIFTLLLMTVMVGFAQAKDITIYVEAEKAPYIHAWESGAGGKILTDTGGKPWTEQPGIQMTESTVVKGKSFWYITFTTDKTINVLFNSGPGPVVLQTKDINDISTDRYFKYDGKKTYTDISDQYIEVPDAVVEFLALSGNHKADWDTNDIFTVLEEDKKFEIFVDLTGVEIKDEDELGERWEFRIRPNGQGSINAKNATTIEDPDNVLNSEDPSIENFVVYLDDQNFYQYTITATWAGGKDSQEGWTVRIEKGDKTHAGVGAIRTTPNDKNAPRYNLAGQRVGSDFQSIVVQNGRKMLVK